MKNASIFSVVLLSMSLAALACGLSAPATPTPLVEAQASAIPGVNPGARPSLEATLVVATATTAPSPSPTSAASPTATEAPLQLEVVQSQAWTDRDGNARVNFLVRNPYDFPVAPGFRARANLHNSAGVFMRSQELYFLDGISGGNGFILPGETVAANGCFTCEQAALTEDWGSVEFESVIKDASGRWDYYTEVKASVGSVTFDGDSPIFWVSGTVKNNTSEQMSRISCRIFVFDQDGKLVGAAEASAWDVGPGASASFKGYGIGKTPGGAVKSEVTALGVKY